MYNFLSLYFHGDSTARSVTLLIGGLLVGKLAIRAGTAIGYKLTN